MLACFFVVVQMGLSAFAFVRYYTLAPVIVNFVVYLAAMVCVMNLLDQPGRSEQPTSRRSRAFEYRMLFGCFFIALVIHRQEGLFILTMATLTAIWLWVNRWMIKIPTVWGRLSISMIVLAIGLLIAVLALWFAFDKPPVVSATDPKVIRLATPFDPWYSLHILNPYYQFFQVITIWGALVSLIFFVKFHWLKRQPLMVIGMLSPLFTVFNPFFVDVYLRMEGELSLWQLCWLVPLHFIAAAFIVENVMKWKTYGALKRNLVAFVVAALFVMPTGNSISEQFNPHLRTSLSATDQKNSYHHWQDMITALNELEPSQNILTDPVTGYLIAALTKHRTFRRKFHASAHYQIYPFVFDNYENSPLSRYQNWLLVINQRDGAKSHSGEAYKHWPGDVLKVSRHYPQVLKDHLRDNPEYFDQIWAAEGVSIYRIK